MNLTPLPVHDRLRRSATEADRGDETVTIAEFLVLEECVARCESLADRIAAAGAAQVLMGELSECIAACQTYLAAKARESRFESRLRAYCAEVLAATAASCGSLQIDEAKACRKIIRAGLKLLRAHRTTAEASCN